MAQTSSSAQGSSVSLPPVTVNAPKLHTQSRNASRQKQATAHATRQTTNRPSHGTETAPRPETVAGKGSFQQGNGPIQGYVAHRTLVGTKTNTSILEIPQAISVVGREQIQDQGAQTAVQALGYTAGVATNNDPNDTRFESLRIRGFAPVLYLDGMMMPVGALGFADPKLDMSLLERIEVLKGPSSSLYGQIPPGGMVNLVSRLPSANPVNSVEFTADNWGLLRTNFDIGGVDPKNNVMYRITGSLHDGGTQVDFVNDFRGAIAPSVTWKPDADTTFTVLSGYQRDITGVALQFLPAQGTLLPNPNGQVPLSKFVGEPAYDQYDRSQYWVGYQFEHSFDQVWTVRQNVRYMGLDTNTYAVAGAGAVGAPALQSNLQTLNRYAFFFPENAQAFTMDNEAEARFATGPLLHDVLLGLDYRYSTSDLHEGYALAPSVNLYNTVYGAPITAPSVSINSAQVQDQTGVYLQDQIALDHWRLTLSGRHDWVSTDTLNVIAGTAQYQKDSAFSGRAGLNYVFDFGLSPYIAYAQSFQPAVGALIFSGASAMPTTGQQVEVGAKYQPVGTNLLLTGALFNIVQQNVVTPDTAPMHTGYSVQIGEARARGAEFEATASLTEGLKLTASYTYTDTDVTKTTTASQLGKHLIIMPMNQAALWADYTFQQGQLAGFGLGGGVRYTGDSYGDAANTILIPGYTLFDAAVHYDLSYLDTRLRGVKLAINATNLFNKYYVATCTSLNACYLGSGRTVMGSIRYTW
jgi:iron complex outermembrane receptor protein